MCNNADQYYNTSTTKLDNHKKTIIQTQDSEFHVTDPGIIYIYKHM